ncbi:MAG TPA: prephenate dehydratase [Pirellulales bacterium]
MRGDGHESSKKPASADKTTSSSHAAAAAAAKKAAGKRANLPQLTADLERFDRELVKLIARRSEAAIKLSELTADPDDDGLHAAIPSEAAQLEAALAQHAGPLSIESVRAVFLELLAGVRTVRKPQRVAFLGPSYSYSHLATLERFGHAAHLVPLSSIPAVFEAVNRGDAAVGIVPLENSTDGRIVDTLDMFTRLPVRICGEIQIRIHHCLLAKCKRDEITQVYSRPQALSQCRDWLAKQLGSARQISMTSTAAAAELARDKPGAAAIASREAGVHYGLEVVAENIEDNASNVTRFAVISNQSAPRTGKDKTALMFQVPHESGALADALTIFKKQNLNLSWVESFPIPHQRDGYLFFVEVNGHSDDEPVRKALDSLAKRTLRLEVLGSFPSSEVPAES